MGKILYLSEHRMDPGAKTIAAPKLLTGSKALRARAMMQQFKDVREKIKEQARELGVYYRVRAPSKPEDYDLRVGRVAYAMYILDSLEQALHVIEKRGGEDAIRSFESAAKAARNIFGPDYFSLNESQIISSHLLAEGPLSACMSKVGMQVLLPEPAINSKLKELGLMIDALNQLYF